MKRCISGILPLAILVCVSMPAFFSCTHEPLFQNENDTICFERDVFPILQTSCGITGCHAAGSGVEGFSVAGYNAILNYVNPGNPKSSSLYNVITNIWGEHMMPPDRPLTLQQRTIIHLWIAQGAENTSCSGGTVANGGDIVENKDTVCFNQHILPIFISNCSMTGCHDGMAQGEDNELYALNSFGTIFPHVAPFNAEESKVYKAINGSGEDLMPPPPKPALNTVQKELIKKWIDQGAVNSNCPAAVCDTSGTIAFAARVKPIIDNYCVSCHNSASLNGGVNLNGYAQIKTYAETLRNGIPLLTGTIRHLAGFKAMPPSTQLDNCSIRKIELWIEQGRLNN